jgi:ABC-2 type transport system ATP-binding protein
MAASGSGSASAEVIVTQGLSKSYRGVAALDDLALNVPRHSIFGFLGPNGAGKTTTIKLLLGLTRPTRGSANVIGHDAVEESLAIRQRVGYLAQQPQFYDHLTARETLNFTASLFFRGPRSAIHRRVAESLDLVGLSARADRPVRGFSGGERQRLGIAQAYINHPDLLILDEPAASLDPMGRRDVLEVMERLRERTTVFYSTHILDDVERVSDRVAILAAGRLIAEAPVSELLASNGAATYELTFRGSEDGLEARIGSEPWVTSVVRAADGPLTTLTVGVADERAAEERLLRLALVDEHTTVTAFGRTRHSLEDVFMDLVQDGGPR